MREGWARFLDRLNLCGAGRAAASYWRDGPKVSFRLVSGLGSNGGIANCKVSVSRTLTVATIEQERCEGRLVHTEAIPGERIARANGF